MSSKVRDATVYIAGPGHSGSTLLDMLLGQHPMVRALGEIHRFYLSLNKSTRPHLCDCGRPVIECPFWIEVLASLSESTGCSLKDLTSTFYTTDPDNLHIADDGDILREVARPSRYPLAMGKILLTICSPGVLEVVARFSKSVSLHRRIARNSYLLFDAVRRVSGSPIIIDSTKNPVRLRALSLERPQEFRVINMIRDGRAVTHSRLKRHAITMGEAARIWKSEHQKSRLVQRAIPVDRKLDVHYEELCTNPDVEIGRVCRFLEIPVIPVDTKFRDAERHAIGGNPMRFRKHENEVRLRETWKHELSDEQVEQFEKNAGGLNRSLGYV